MDPKENWELQFENYNGGSGGNYRLRAGNLYAAAGNADVGANIDAVEAAVACVPQGVCQPPPTIILADDFTGSGAPDPTKWTAGTFSGPQNLTINVATANAGTAIFDNFKAARP